jgi:hypothetical protein
MDAILIFIVALTVVLFLIYKNLQRKSFKPPAVIIGNRKYYDIANRLYVNVLDFDGVNVHFTFEMESEIAEPQSLGQKEFLARFKKVGRPNIGRDDDNIVP